MKFKHTVMILAVVMVFCVFTGCNKETSEKTPEQETTITEDTSDNKSSKRSKVLDPTKIEGLIRIEVDNDDLEGDYIYEYEQGKLIKETHSVDGREYVSEYEYEGDRLDFKYTYCDGEEYSVVRYSYVNYRLDAELFLNKTDGKTITTCYLYSDGIMLYKEEYTEDYKMVIEYHRDDDGDMDKETLHYYSFDPDTVNKEYWDTTLYSYNDDGTVQSKKIYETHDKDAELTDDKLFYDVTYTYDEFGNKISQTNISYDTQGNATEEEITWDYEFDDEGRILKIIENGGSSDGSTTTYYYDD